MKIYLRRDTSSENSRYIVYRDNGDELYKITGKHKSGFERLYVCDKDKIVAKIRETGVSVLRSCHISLTNDSFHFLYACSNEKMTINFFSVPFHIRGSILEKSYDILDVDNTLISSVQKRFKTSVDTLEINIYNEKYLLHCLCSAVCLNSICTTDAPMLQTT